MGCISSKLYNESDFNRELVFNNNGDCTTHIVSLTSSSYGFLKLDSEPTTTIKETENKKQRDGKKEDFFEPEIINAWELMGDLEDEMGISKSPKLSVPDHHHHRQVSVLKKQRRFTGKENKQRGASEFDDNGGRRLEILKPFREVENIQKVPALKIAAKTSNLTDFKIDSFRSENGFFTPKHSFRSETGFLTPKQSFSPLFDPELLTSFQIELDEEMEQIKNMISQEPRNSKAKESELMLELFEKKCPPGGENEVIIYTTTLRGIRKTFEDCNKVRAVIESHNVRMIERDVSMDSGFREELRNLVGKNEIKLPVVFVKGRLIGGVEEVVKLEEEGLLERVFEGIARAQIVCDRCFGIRFLMCMDCNGSCKVLDDEEKEMVRCEQCNENGLIQCPFCS